MDDMPSTIHRRTPHSSSLYDGAILLDFGYGFQPEVLRGDRPPLPGLRFPREQCACINNDSHPNFQKTIERKEPVTQMLSGGYRFCALEGKAS